MNFIRRMLNHFGLARSVAQTPDPLIERADRVIQDVDTLSVHVVTRREARLRALDLQAEIQAGVRRRR